MTPAITSPTVPRAWHPGETAIQTKLNYTALPNKSWVIEPQLREQHRIFHTSNLPFIPLTIIDKDNRPWAGIAAGRDGRVGFVSGEKEDLTRLRLRLKSWRGDPLFEGLGEGLHGAGGMMTAGLGIEFPTRRRNKFAGAFREVKNLGGGEFMVDIEVNEATGNCPKYINTRTLDPHPDTNPQVVHQVRNMPPSERLPASVIEMIKAADTVFIASVYKATPDTALEFPSLAGMNARSGLPGFIRVLPSDGRTVVLPDYSGNRFMSSLGNIEASRVAGLTMVSFETGDILYLTGEAEVLIGPPAMEIMSRHACILVLKVTGYALVQDALPVRQRPGTIVGQSPYSPKIKYLVEEAETQPGSTNDYKAQLESAVQLSEDLAVFKFKILNKPDTTATVSPLKIRPGQAIVLDFMAWLGPPQYQHMSDAAPGSINDDRVRTWTVSSAHKDGNATWFELTMREMKGGAVTGALFNMLRRPSQGWGQVIAINQPVIADIVGVTGDFFLGNNHIHALWVAGGIGITPFLAMLDALVSRGDTINADIVFVLATREPVLMLQLVGGLLRNVAAMVKVKIDLFTRGPFNFDTAFGSNNTQLSVYEGRIGPEYWRNVSKDRDVLICGPNGFGNSAVDGLRAAGVPNDKIQREGFY